MFQILLLKNPLAKPGLGAIQRLSYLSSMAFWFFPIPRLIFMLAPLLHIFFDVKIFVASIDEAVAFTATYVVANMMMQNYLYGRLRWPWVSELYEYVQGVYLIRSIASVLISPRKPHFNVTNKGAGLDGNRLSALAGPYFAIFGLLAAGCATAAWRYLYEPGVTSLMLVVGLWCLFNLVVAGAALGVVAERRRSETHASLPTARSARLDLGSETVAVTVERAAAETCILRRRDGAAWGGRAPCLRHPDARARCRPRRAGPPSRSPVRAARGSSHRDGRGADARRRLHFGRPDLRRSGARCAPSSSGRRRHDNLLTGSLRLLGWGVTEPCARRRLRRRRSAPTGRRRTPSRSPLRRPPPRRGRGARDAAASAGPRDPAGRAAHRPTTRPAGRSGGQAALALLGRGVARGGRGPAETRDPPGRHGRHGFEPAEWQACIAALAAAERKIEAGRHTPATASPAAAVLTVPEANPCRSCRARRRDPVSRGPPCGGSPEMSAMRFSLPLVCSAAPPPAAQSFSGYGPARPMLLPQAPGRDAAAEAPTRSAPALRRPGSVAASLRLAGENGAVTLPLTVTEAEARAGGRFQLATSRRSRAARGLDPDVFGQRHRDRRDRHRRRPRAAQRGLRRAAGPSRPRPSSGADRRGPAPPGRLLGRRHPTNCGPRSTATPPASSPPPRRCPASTTSRPCPSPPTAPCRSPDPGRRAALHPRVRAPARRASVATVLAGTLRPAAGAVRPSADGDGLAMAAAPAANSRKRSICPASGPSPGRVLALLPAANGRAADPRRHRPRRGGGRCGSGRTRPPPRGRAARHPAGLRALALAKPRAARSRANRPDARRSRFRRPARQRPQHRIEFDLALPHDILAAVLRPLTLAISTVRMPPGSTRRPASASRSTAPSPQHAARQAAGARAFPAARSCCRCSCCGPVSTM